MNRIIIVDDDPQILSKLGEFLTSEGMEVSPASGQTEFFDIFEDTRADLVLLDINLKDGSGFALLQWIRKISDVPVIFLSALDDEQSAVLGLDMGANDYIVKPFRPRELVSRIKRQISLHSGAGSEIKIGDVTVDPKKAAAYKNGADVHLSALEYRLLQLFINHRGMALSRRSLLESLWDISGMHVNDNTLTVYIKRLREKIETDPSEPQIIRTIRG